jgi:hypothetical protein
MTDKRPTCPKCESERIGLIPWEPRLCVSIVGQHGYLGCLDCGAALHKREDKQDERRPSRPEGR